MNCMKSSLVLKIFIPFGLIVLMLIGISFSAYSGETVCFGNTIGETRKIIVLDSGHSRKYGGAISSEAIFEVEYNDILTKQIKTTLEILNSYLIFLTRKPDEEITLEERKTKASKLNANLFISIHHDSAQRKYLKKRVVNGKSGWKTIRAIRGFSIFISPENGNYKASLKFAELLGEELLKIGRLPTHHHAEKIPGENRILLNPKLGIYHYDSLAILRGTKIPGVLLEAGVIVDPKDEAYLRKDRNQMDIAEAVKKAVKHYFANADR